jgi:methylated-DNA-[protein]-cysteine S-methyltransferase
MWLDGERLLHHEHPRPGPAGDDAEHPLAARLVRYFACGEGDFGDVELDLDGASGFERDVTEALRGVPVGETVTYGELAALAGHPGAQRAAGTFCARNRFAIVVPCHRVVAADGLGSYGSLGVGYKRRLLELEGVAV